MKKFKLPKIETSSSDDLLYHSIINTLHDIRLTQGGTALDSTLRRHNVLRDYLISKQINILNGYESEFFNSDGSLNLDSLKSLHDFSKSCYNNGVGSL